MEDRRSRMDAILNPPSSILDPETRKEESWKNYF